ncbi:MAG: hypothetical protein IKK82_14975 [Kiritimatiellae bacterium]|nr:hypothetical protein [Kiritimatiellia bacterium]
MNRKIKLLGVVAALLAQCPALHALTEEDFATLDAAFEATFRESPSGGMGVWTDPSKVPTNYTEWAYALTTREGCLERFRRHLPQGALYTDDEICEAFPICLQRRCVAQLASTNKWTLAWECDEGIVDNMFFLCENALASTNNIPVMEVIGASEAETNVMYKSDAFESIMAALGMTDESTRYLCAAYTNSTHWARGIVPAAIYGYIPVYTNGCDSATSSVVENAAATFNPLTWQARYWIPTVDTLAAVAVPGYKNSHERAEYVSNKLERADTTFYERRYLLEVKAQLDALTESDFTVPNFMGTPQW